MKLIEMVGPGKKVRFVRYQDRTFWYVTDDGFEFPIDIDDSLGATLLAEDKAIFFMRWIRKHHIAVAHHSELARLAKDQS